MRHWEFWVTGALLLGLAGCAGTKPCVVIPAQIELAEDLREGARIRFEEKLKEMKRWQHAIEQSQTRLARLKEDRDRLREEVVGSGEEGK